MSSLIRSFANDLESLVKKRGDETALIVPAEIDPLYISYRQLDQLTKRCLSFFEEQGLRPGDIVFSLMPNAAETLVCFLATILGGYGFAPLPCTASEREIERWILLVKPKLCLTTNMITKEAANALAAHKIPIELIVVDSEFSWLPPQKEKSSIAPGARLYLSTSGTTGEPKAIVIEANTLWSSACAFVRFHDLEDSTLRFWNFLPMSYLGGLFNLALIPLCLGGSIVIDQTFSGKTFLEFWQTVERFDICAIWFVPTIVRGLLSMAERSSASGLRALGARIKTSFIGTAPIDLETKRKFEQLFGITLLENFALSETTFFSSETEQNVANRCEGSTGEILPYTEVKLVALEETQDSPKEIYVKSPFLFLGYLTLDGNLSLPIDADGYLPTGDLGELIHNDILVLKGRSKDIIKRGGYLVHLREIEVLAEQHPAVHEAAALKTKHSFYGESFDIYVTLASGHNDSELDEIGSYLHKNLIKYKWPDKIAIVKEFPKTDSGKIQKHFITQFKEEVKL